MSEAAARQTLELLVELHHWMTIDFVYQMNHGDSIDSGPAGQFVANYSKLRIQLPPQVRTEVEATWNELVQGIEQMAGRLQLMIDHNHKGTYLDVPAWEQEASAFWTAVVRKYEDSLDNLRGHLQDEIPRSAAISLPSLRSVGGGVTIVGDISDSTGVAVGRSAQANVGQRPRRGLLPRLWSKRGG